MEMIFEILKQVEKKKKEIKKEVEKNFRSAEELGIIKGDLIIYKDGETTCVNNPKDLMIRFKRIAEVRRPVEWEPVEIIKPKRKTRKGDK